MGRLAGDRFISISEKISQDEKAYHETIWESYIILKSKRI